MKILGRIKKSKVLTAVMTAVLILQSACPTGLAYAAEQARSSAVLTVTASVDDLDETLPTLKSPTDFTAGSAIGTCPAFWVANDDGTSYVEALMAKKQKQGLALNWYNEETGESFDWYKTKVTDSIHVVGKWEKYDVSVTFSANDGTTKSDTETVPYGQSYKQAFGKEKAAPATRKGYEFAGWYDSTTNEPFDFTKKLTDPTLSVYAKWNLKDAVEVSPSDTARPAQTATGTCSINGTWFGSPFPWGSIARFNLSNFTGELAGATVNDAQCVDSGAENPYLAGRRSATYQATLTSFDETTGKAVYDVYLYPAGHATGDMYVVRPPQDSYHNTQVGVQRMHTTITVYKVVKGYIEIQKASTCTNVSDNNKLYSLAGAEFSIYDASGKFVQKLTTNEKGETGRSGLLTAGTYTVKETKAPEGYYAADDFTVTVNAGQVTKKTVGDKPYNDPLAMLVGKFDGEKTYNGAGNLPQGSATLADAEFTVDYYDTFDYDNYDVLKKADIEPTRSWTFKTDADGFSYFDTEHFVSGDAFFYNEQNNICIPRGTIVVRETKAPTGYLKSNAVSFQKIMEGSNTEALKTYNLAEVPEQVYRSDFEFTKKAENGSDRLAGVPFKVTSLTTGESHIAVTDENGYFSSASSWNAHDGNTNANDWALTADGTIDSARLDATAGFWFGNNTVLDADGHATTGDAIKADNALGAMPFDTYSVEELRCTANEGHALVNTTVTISRNGATIDFGTLDDPEPEIHTTAYDASDSDHYIGVGTVKVSDKVEYSHLVAGKSYTVTGELRDAETGDVLKVNGKTVTASQTFTAEKSNGSVTVDFTFDSYDLAGKTLVVYETLTDANGAKLAEHKDKDDVSQQVTVLKPEIGTTATDKADGDKNVVSEPEATITDTVRYVNLTPGKTYKVTGTLYEKVKGKDGKVTEKKFTVNGKDVTAETEFTAEKSSGEVEVTFTFDASAIKDGTELVAFETVSSDGHEICAHADIEDEGQTVTVTKPEVGTTATDGFDGDKNVVADTDATVTDTVHYKNLTPGKTYKVTGTLYQKVTDKDGKVTKKKLTVDGKDVTAETEFTAETSDGDATVTFKFDASGIKDKTPLVAFESLSYKDKELCAHADIEDEDQTVTVNQPSVGTTATDKLDGDKTVIADAESSVTDEVAYDHVLTGKSYTMAGILMDAKTGLPVLTGEGAKKFTEDDLVKFTTGLLDVLGFKSDSDEDGIDWSAVKSLPTASIDLSKVTAYAEENKELLSCLVYQTAEFTPEKESGSIDMDYAFNSNDVIDRLSGETKNLVVFEVMFKGSIENASDETPVSIVASECDKDNEGQTVKLAPSTIGTTATDKSDGDHELMAGKDSVITDEVKYEGLIPGKEYTLHATLRDKKTGEPLKVADKGVTAELKFTPNSENGTVSIDLGEFDATSLDGHTLVVFEELTKQSDIDGDTTDVTVAEHKDINDEGQSVTVTSTPAGSTYGKTGVDMTNIAIAIGILLIAAGCATAYGIKSRKTTKGDADESAEDNTEA
jgi:uncharacterized repeat protein (TIGR02543 family)